MHFEHGIKVHRAEVVLEDHATSYASQHSGNIHSPISQFSLHLIQQNKMCSDDFIEEDKSQYIDEGPHQPTYSGTAHPVEVEVIVEVQESSSERFR